MLRKYAVIAGALAALALPLSPASAQTALKWAHVYETSEPFHTESVWAAEEIGKRTEGRYKIDVFPASQLGKESDINQGLTLGTVDIIISGSSFAAREFPPHRRHLFPVHLPRRRPPARLQQERQIQGADGRLRGGVGPPHRGDDLLRNAPHHLEPADREMRRHAGAEDPRA